jgi:hypothetical protein
MNNVVIKILGDRGLTTMKGGVGSGTFWRAPARARLDQSFGLPTSKPRRRYRADRK